MRRNEYYKQQRKIKPETYANYDKKRREKPETRARELLRLKLRYSKVKEYENFKKAIPHFLTV